MAQCPAVCYNVVQADNIPIAEAGGKVRENLSRRMLSPGVPVNGGAGRLSAGRSGISTERRKLL